MGGEHTFDDIDRAAAALEAMVTGVDVALLTGPGAARLVTRLVTAERVLASCRSRAMRRAAEANQWSQAGERSPAAWAAKVLGTTTGHAAADLETTTLLDSLPATRTARDTGAISGLQAREIAGAATADPAAETLLLRRAAIDDATSLRRRCAQVRAAAETDESTARERLRQERRFRSWTDPEGGFCFTGRGLPEHGAALLAAIRPHQDAAYQAARRSGGRNNRRLRLRRAHHPRPTRAPTPHARSGDRAATRGQQPRREPPPHEQRRVGQRNPTHVHRHPR